MPVATLAQCANTGVTAAQYGNILDNSAGQYNGLFGGSTALMPETADSYTVGLVFKPAFLDGFSLTVDYFDIQVDDVIGTVPPTISLNECLEHGQSAVLRPDPARLARHPLGVERCVHLGAEHQHRRSLDQRR